MRPITNDFYENYLDFISNILDQIVMNYIFDDYHIS